MESNLCQAFGKQCIKCCYNFLPKKKYNRPGLELFLNANTLLFNEIVKKRGDLKELKEYSLSRFKLNTNINGCIYLGWLSENKPGCLIYPRRRNEEDLRVIAPGTTCKPHIKCDNYYLFARMDEQSQKKVFAEVMNLDWYSYGNRIEHLIPTIYYKNDENIKKRIDIKDFLMDIKTKIMGGFDIGICREMIANYFVTNIKIPNKHRGMNEYNMSSSLNVILALMKDLPPNKIKKIYIGTKMALQYIYTMDKYVENGDPMFRNNALLLKSKIKRKYPSKETEFNNLFKYFNEYWNYEKDVKKKIRTNTSFTIEELFELTYRRSSDCYLYYLILEYYIGKNEDIKSMMHINMMLSDLFDDIIDFYDDIDGYEINIYGLMFLDKYKYSDLKGKNITNIFEENEQYKQKTISLIKMVLKEVKHFKDNSPQSQVMYNMIIDKLNSFKRNYFFIFHQVKS